MTRRAGQVRSREALVGLFALVGFVGLVVALTSWLALPEEPLAVVTEDTTASSCGQRVQRAAGSGPAEVAEVSSTDLIDCPRSFDGMTVRYQGEVVGAVLQRGERAWVQLNDDPYALSAGPLPGHRAALGGNSGMAVSVPVGTARSLEVGSYRRQGAVLEVVGQFRRADPGDGGGPAIQAVQVEQVRASRAIDHTVSVRRVATAALLGAVVVGLAGVTIRTRRR